MANLRNAPPAPVGNRRPATHGAYAKIVEERLEVKVREVFTALAGDVPVRSDDGGLPREDTAAVRMLAETMCRLDDISDYLQRRGWEDESGKPRPVLEYEARLRTHALELLRELGLTPAARAKLGLDLARVASAQDRLNEHLQANYGDTIDGEVSSTLPSDQTPTEEHP